MYKIKRICLILLTLTSSLLFSGEEVRYINTINIMIIGDSNVGKTALVRRLLDNDWAPQSSSHIGFNFSVKFLRYKNHLIELNLRDSNGRRNFNFISSYLFPSTDGYILMFDYQERESLKNILYWYNLLKQNNQEKKPIIIVGNKFDVHPSDKMRPNEIKAALSGSLNRFPLINVSNKTNYQVRLAFTKLISLILEKK